MDVDVAPKNGDANGREVPGPGSCGPYAVALYNLGRPHRPLANRTPIAVWRDGVTGAPGDTAVDMTLRLDNAAALPTAATAPSNSCGLRIEGK
jgi:hypothetical protein